MQNSSLIEKYQAVVVAAVVVLSGTTIGHQFPFHSPAIARLRWLHFCLFHKTAYCYSYNYLLKSSTILKYSKDFMQLCSKISKIKNYSRKMRFK